MKMAVGKEISNPTVSHVRSFTGGIVGIIREIKTEAALASVRFSVLRAVHQS